MLLKLSLDLVELSHKTTNASTTASVPADKLSDVRYQRIDEGKRL
jgi:hypothetical protein